MFGRYTSILFLLALLALPLAAQTTGSLTGQITDETGASIPAATVSVLKAGALVKTVTTNEQGQFSVPNLLPGTYALRVTHFGFTNVETRLQLAAGQKATFNSQLKLQTEAQSVTVQGESVGTVSVDASQNAGALVLKQEEIDALPDDPDDLATDLQELAGPSAGPNGGQIYIDGFTGGRLPPKESIREIRINQNPFSSEYDKLGYGRIEILTKPGTDKWHGQAFFNDSDSIFNARNPFLDFSPNFSSRQYGGNVSGALNKKTSLFFDIEERDINDSGVIVADILNPSNAISPFSTAIPTPQRRFDFSPRLDYQLNTTNTLVVKYSYLHNTVTDSGVGNFNLASQGINTSSYENSIQLTETAVLSPKAINETRFRWLRDSETDTAQQNGTTINVSSAFVSGGISTPKSITGLDNYEVQNYTSLTEGTQAFKFGVRLRTYQYNQNIPSNFLGTFLFAGEPNPADPSGPPLTSIEQYQGTLQGLPGYAPSQFSISTGNPKATINMVDAGIFLQDDWRLKPNLTVNFGLRYEIQNLISDYGDWAPRFGFAWSPDSKGNKQGKTVIRGGWGIFYDRFQYSYGINAQIYNGTTIERYIVTDPSVLASFPTPPPASAYTAVGQTIDQIDPHFRAEYNMQGALGIERALPKNSRIAVNFMNTRGEHMYLTRNINAPDPYLPDDARPYQSTLGDENIYNYESNGIYRQNQMIVSFNTAFVPGTSLFSWYTLQSAHSNTDGIGSSPANQYDLAADYSRAAFDVRNRLFFGGSSTFRWGIRLSPFLTYQSSRPFNITDGYDYLDTSLYNERPAFTSLPCGSPNVICTPYGKFDTQPGPGDTIIPRNYGNGPSQFSLNIRLAKTWGFGESTTGPAGGNRGGGGGGGPRGGGGGYGGPGGGRGGPMGGMFGDASTGKKYNLTLTAQARNLFNTVNYANPIGVITSPLFGASNQLANTGPGGSNAENRRLEFGLRFAF
jgi:hypothetical protein